MLKYLINLR
uniref:MLA1uORF n=2 Tax=Hordeum vulgare TaxID=4513 RepID=Q7EXP6_HORVV|nr:MLA1uORF [Hordeum vulgare subsp. vulgare]AAG37357.1 Mla1uORF [Hordeum vulgare subsp. vulgare]AAO16013.1 MLA13uORF 2de [Hordeum vulgare]AAO16016.1 MLA13uORF 2de [Hordeum vulgare]